MRINDHVKALVESIISQTQVLNENTATYLSENETARKSTGSDIRALVESTYGEHFQENAMARNILNEAADQVEQMFLNNFAAAQQEHKALLNENATISATMLATTIATTMRRPMETSMYRLYQTETVSDPFFMTHDIKPTVKAPDGVELTIFEAFEKGSTFMAATEIYIPALASTGIALNAKNTYLLDGFDPIYNISRDLRVSGITLKTPVAGSTQRIKKGYSPFFDSKTGTCDVVFEIVDATGAVINTVDVAAKMDFAKNTMVTVYGHADIAKVLFDAKVSHEEHKHPIVTGIKQDETKTYTIPTRPHIEVSVPNETSTDFTNANGPMKGTDLITVLSDQVQTIAGNMEELRLYNNLKMGNGAFEAEFDFEAPANFAGGNIANFRQEFYPLLDQIAAAMKSYYHVYDCYFKVGVNPFIMTLIQPEYTITKGGDGGSSPVSFQVAVKTSSSTFELTTSDRIDADKIKVVMVLNKKDRPEIRTLHYIKYSSFLTDKLRKSSNNALPAIVYSERNLEMTFVDATCDFKIINLPINKNAATGNYIKKR